MNTLDPALLWSGLVIALALAFNAGIIWFQVKSTAKANEQLRLDFHTEGERLRQDLRDHMKDEETTTKLLTENIQAMNETGHQRFTTLLSMLGDIRERLAKLGG